MSPQAERGMVLPISITTKRLIIVLGILIAGFLSYFSVRSALAEYYSELGTLNGYETATRLEPKNAQNWYLLGQYWQHNTVQQDLNRAIQSYLISLSLDSRSADTWLDLASAYESEGDLTSARKAFLQAQHVYPQSADVSSRYGNFLLRQNEKAAGFLEIRSAIEADPRRGLEAFLICRHVEPDLVLILDRALPPVASVYLDVIWQLTSEGRTDQALMVWSKLVSLHPKLQRREVFYFVDGLLNNRRATDAQRVWSQAIALMDLPKLEDPPGSLIWDGGFETDATGGGLAWRFQPSRWITISFDKNVKHTGLRALRIDFSERENFDFDGVCQSIIVEPNTKYEFSAWLRTKQLDQERGVFFRLTTPGIQGSQVVTTPELAGTKDWTRVSVPWTSPDHAPLSEVCLWRLAGLRSNRVPGTAWVDDVSLLKLNTSMEPH
jgi:tetratricopeptide (TPR) repeat protein